MQQYDFTSVNEVLAAAIYAIYVNILPVPPRRCLSSAGGAHLYFGLPSIEKCCLLAKIVDCKNFIVLYCGFNLTCKVGERSSGWVRFK